MKENKLTKILSTKSKKMKTSFFVMFVLFLCSTAVHAQTGPIKGTVTDPTNEPLIGVSVRVLNGEAAALTDFDGNYTINAQEGDNLQFSYIGMVTKVVKVAKSDVVNVTMEDDSQTLGEVVVEVGYGKMKKRDLTGSIVSVKGSELSATPTNSPMSALQGKVPGLNVTNSGGAGSTPSITIRGIGTMNSKTNPVFVVDGMILDNIDFVNMNDILSIEVLKDASSLAIFGVQGANGVIILTTNKANKGATQVKYDGYAGVQYLFDRDRIKLTNATEFTALYNEQLMNLYSDSKASAIAAGTPLPALPTPWEGDLLGKGTDWQSEIFRPAFITNHYLSISSGSEKSNTFISAGYYKQDGVVKYNSYERFNLNFAGDIQVNKAIKFGTNVNVSKWDKKPETGSVQGASRSLPTYSPYTSEIDWDPENKGSQYTPAPNIQKDVGNPVARMELLKNVQKSYGYRGVGNVYTEVKFLQDFMFKAVGYFDVGINYDNAYTPIYNVNNSTSISSQKSLSSNFKKENAEYTKYQADFLLNYNKSVGKSDIGAMIGYTAYENTSEVFSAKTDSIFNNLPNLPEDMWTLDPQSEKMSVTKSYNQESFISYLSRINYSYDHKYLLTATLRADGSSKFSPNKRWGYFPSVGLGWIVTQEEFMDKYKDMIDFLKVKASWGKLGNDKIGNYQYFRKINPNGQLVVVDGNNYYLPTVDGVADSNLHWEVMTGFDAGFDASLFNQRLSLDFGYYTKKTSDLLAYVAVPASVGAGYKVTNAGSVRNSGIEFSVNWYDKIGDVGYNIGFNGSTVRNRVISIGNDDAPLTSDSYHRTAVGHPIGSFYGYVQDGIFQTDAEAAAYISSPWDLRAGDIRYADLTGDGKIDDKDRTFLGSPIPTFIYGISLGVDYRNFDFKMSINGVSGNKILNTKKLQAYSQFNYYDVMLDRWHGEGTSNSEPIINSGRAHNYLSSSNLIESGRYIRIKEIQLGYTIPKTTLEKIGINSLRVYCNIQNPFTFKKNTGYTPEIGGAILTGGVDSGDTYPLPTTFTGGVTLTF